jgi:photosystem II stability/assembly factor-like uncharacterized protein
MISKKHHKETYSLELGDCPATVWRSYLMLHRIILIALFGLLHFTTTHAQQTNVDRNYYLNPDTDQFSLIQSRMEDYYEGREKGRGSGYKQWKRWEYFQQNRLDQNGRLTNHAVRTFYAARKNESQLRMAPMGNWTPLAPTSYSNGESGYNPGLGRVNVIAFHPTDPNTIYAGTPSGGLWRTTDHGGSWTPLTDNLPRIGISGIVIHPSNPNHVYILTGDGDGGDTKSVGVYSTLNGGTTWDPTGLVFGVQDEVRGYKLAMHPNNPDILYAATDSCLFRSADAGISWTNVQDGRFTDIEFKPNDPSVMYLSGKLFFRSTDTGATWTQITSGVPTGTSRMEIGVSANEPGHVYLISGPGGPISGSFKGVFRSTDSGISFTNTTTTPNILSYSTIGSGTSTQYTYDLAIAINPNNAQEVITGGINIWKSINAADTFAIKTHWKTDVQTSNGLSYSHADIHELVYHPINNNLYCGSDGGIYVSYDQGETYVDLSAGMQITQFYRIDGHEPDPNLFIGGTQDNGTNIRTSGSHITHIYGADGMDCIIDHTTPSTLYFMTQNGGLRKSTDGGQNSFSIKPSGASGSWVTPMVMDPTNPQILYTGYSDIYKTINGGATWSNLTNLSGSGAMAIGTNNPNRIYSSSGSQIRMTSNGGTTWSNISTGLPPDQNITSIAVNPDSSTNVFVTLSGFVDGEKVYVSADAGSTWTNISGSLPNIPINCIAYEDRNGTPAGALCIGTDVGVWYRNDNLGNWIPFENGLPRTIVMDIEINEANNLIRAGTYGRGIWTSTTADCIAVASSNSPICPGDALNLNVEVTGQGPFSYAWSGPADVWINSGTATPTAFGASSGDYSVTVTGACGSVISTTSVVVNTPPEINVPGPLLLYTEEDNCVATLNVLDLYSLVNVSGTPTPQLSFAINNNYPVGIHTITGDASNACGTDQATVDIVVTDTLPPIAKCRNINVEINEQSTTVTGYDVDDGSSDPCGIAILELNGQDMVTLDNDDVGLNVVTMTATDIYGNQSSCEAVITVEKNLCPEGNDAIDSDQGGLPDDCDCSPFDAFNDKLLLQQEVNIGMDFDGVDDFLSVPNEAEFNPSNTRSITLEAWIKSDLTKQLNTIISKGDGGLLQTAYVFTVWEFDDIAFFFGANDGGIGALVQADSALTPNVWTHVAATFNHVDSTVALYYNGAMVKQQVVAYTPWSVDTQPLFIGKRGYNCDCDHFDGQMEEVRVWSTARSQEDIALFMDKELKGAEQDLLANYNFNDGLPGGDNTGLSIVKDHTPFDHDATLSGFTQNGTASNWINDTIALVQVNTDTLDLCLSCPQGTNVGMDFDGIDDEISINHDPVFIPAVGTPFTFEAWVNPAPGQVAQTILSKGNGNNGLTSYIFSIFQNKIALFIGDGAQATWIYSDTDITFNTWSHVAVAYDGVGNDFTFYLNGVANGQRTIPHGFFSNIDPLYIGRQGALCNCNHFLGQMEEVRIWNVTRSQSQIQASMNHELYGGEVGLVGYYSFNNGLPNGDNTNRTVIPDMSINDHEGVLSGFAKTGNSSNWVSTSLSLSGPQNAALDFDGVNDYFRIPNHPTLIPTATNAVTYETWIYPEESTNGLGLLSSSGSFPDRNHQIYLTNSTNQISVDGIGVNVLKSNATVPFNTWTHVAVVFDMTETRLYINGQLDNTRVQTLEPNNLGFDVTFGQQDSGSPGTWSFQGKMDDARIWDHARTSDQILDHMDQELTGIESGLAAYYNLNNGLPEGDNSSVTHVEDISSNGNTGSLNGFAKTGTSSNWVFSPFNFGDSDQDGTPDFCDACIANETLLLENMGIPSSAVYRATKEIILGENLTLVPFAFIDLRAPKVTVRQNANLQLQGLFTINPSPCPN